MRIGINGFGRVGRCFLRAVTGVAGINVVALNCTMGPAQCAHFLKWDSTHGPFKHNVTAGDSWISIDGGAPIAITNNREPGHMRGIDVVVECSGCFNKREQALRHLAHGVRAVLISAPSDKPDKTIIYGVNHDILSTEDRIVSVGSCTSNCLLPVVDALHSAFVLRSGFFVTVHAYTNDQRMLDANHEDLRRARAGAVSIIPTSTGASKVIGEIFPEISSSIKGSAVRVPVSDVSLIDFSFCTEKAVTRESIQQCFIDYKSTVLTYTYDPLVSVDFIGNTSSAIVDMNEIIGVTQNQARVLVWYDNEWGFVARMVDVLLHMRKSL